MKSFSTIIKSVFVLSFFTLNNLFCPPVQDSFLAFIAAAPPVIKAGVNKAHISFGKIIRSADLMYEKIARRHNCFVKLNLTLRAKLLEFELYSNLLDIAFRSEDQDFTLALCDRINELIVQIMFQYGKVLDDGSCLLEQQGIVVHFFEVYGLDKSGELRGIWLECLNFDGKRLMAPLIRETLQQGEKSIYQMRLVSSETDLLIEKLYNLEVFYHSIVTFLRWQADDLKEIKRKISMFTRFVKQARDESCFIS